MWLITYKQNGQYHKVKTKNRKEAEDKWTWACRMFRQGHISKLCALSPHGVKL